MKAHDSYLISLLKLSDAVFNIPVYQRNYDWDTENCKQLFLDLENITVTQKEHFIGSIVYISIGTATEPYYNIIDGQQRITSVMLFLKALHDSTEDKDFRRRIRFGFLVNMGLDDNPKMKLKQVESDRSVYEKIIMQEKFDSQAFTDKEKESNVFKNYSCFKNLISQSEASLHDLYNAVFKLEIIDVCLTTEDPQEVFESMNSTGRSLTNTDLLRNYLLMDLTHSEQEKLYRKYWSQIEKNVGPKQMENYMVHYLIMKRKSDSVNLRRKSAKINKNTLYDCYKLYFPPEKKKDGGTEELLNDLFQYSNIYKRIIKQTELKNNMDRALYELIYELSADPVAIFLMYLMNYQTEAGISDDEMLKAVQACISYVFRVRIFKGSVSNQFFALAIQYFERCDPSRAFVDRVWEALISGQGSYRFPKNHEFQDAFETKNMYLEFKPQMLRYMLYKFERSRTKEVVEPDNVTIEHILPQEPKEWEKHLADIHDTEYKDLTHRIGNLTLTKMNSEASNDPFEEKKKIYKKSGYALTREIAEMNDWNSFEIKRRSANMAKEALTLWPLPEEFNKNLDKIWQSGSMSDEVEDLFSNFCTLVRDYYPSLYEDPKKHYINFMRNYKVIFSLIPYQESMLVTLNTSVDKLTPNQNLEDVSEKPHWGVGNCRMSITSEEDIWVALEYIQQITEK